MTALSQRFHTNARAVRPSPLALCGQDSKLFSVRPVDERTDVSLAYHVDELDTGEGSPGRLERLKTERRMHPLLHEPMVLLDDVVQVPAPAVWRWTRPQQLCPWKRPTRLRSAVREP